MPDLSIEIPDQSDVIKNIETPVVKTESIQPPIKEIPKSIIEKIKNKLPFWKSQVQTKPVEVIADIAKIEEPVPTEQSPETIERPEISKQQQLKEQITSFENWNKLSSDEYINLFEKYIQEMSVPEEFIDDASFDSIVDKGNIISNVFKDKSLDITVDTIETSHYEPNDPRVADLPKNLRENLPRIFKNNHKEEDVEIHHDPKLIKLWNLVDAYYNKQIELQEAEGTIDKPSAYYGKTHREIIESKRNEDFSSYPIINEILYEKRVEGQIITPESFIGHGTYFENFKKMLTEGEVKSPWYAKKTSDPELGLRTIEIDPGAIFFFSDKNRDNPIGQYGDLHRGGTDIGIIYRIDDILDKGYTIGTKNGTDSKSEVFVTNTPKAFEKNDLEPLQRRELAIEDTTSLSLKDAYIRIGNSDVYNETINLLKSKGFTDEWIKERVTYLDNRDQHPRPFTQWLKSRPFTPKSERQNLKFTPTEGWKHNYFIWNQTKSEN